MTSASSTYISREAQEKIREYANDVADVARRWGKSVLTEKRNKLVCDCPKCGARDGLEIVTSGAKRGVWKCFHCDQGGKGGVALLTDAYGVDWREAYQWIAQQYHVDVAPPPESVAEVIEKHRNRVTFRDLQLKHSGIPESAIVSMVPVESGKQVEQKRYTTGTMLPDGTYTAKGDDMVLWYLDLDSRYITYKSGGKGGAKPLIRVRYQHPDLHLDKEGRPVKYRSPYGSGSHLWMPNHIISQHAKGEQIRRLFVVEGEKKADKMCLHGMPAVGIMGIHNMAYDNEMPRAFELLITRCQIEEVVFVLDSDWQDISIRQGRPVDSRPRTFLRAIQKFREYFYAYRNSGIDLRIYMSAGKDKALKGMDDLLTALADPDCLAPDVEKAITDAQGKGEHVVAYNIHPLRVPDQKLLELFNLDDPQKFIATHKEHLREAGEFTLGKLLYFFNADTDDFELANQILESEKFWNIETFYDRSGRERRECKFNYDTIRTFLFNRGIGLYEYQEGMYRMVRRENNFLHDVTHTWIQRYVVEFAETIKERMERSDVVQMLLRGNTQFLGPNNLNYMRLHQPEWIRQSANEQYMVFRNCFWRITPDSIEQRPLNELRGCIWGNQVIQFDAQYLGEPLVEVSRDEKGAWSIRESKHVKPTDENPLSPCEMYEYLKCTSLFAWQKLYELGHDDEGALKYFAKSKPDPLTDDDRRIWIMHMVTKLIGWGYKLRTYRDLSNMRAIICMDGLESQVGKSQGGSGKSIYAMATQYCQPVFTVDGKTADLKSDKFVYHGVDDRTREIVIDDVSVNFPFELLFSQITNFIRVKPFQGAPITLPAPVFTITTNHAMNGEGNSFKRRQYLLGFSNFFNEHRTPAHYFGHQLFSDWDAPQWNMYYNFMATAVQTYMRFADLGRFAIESDDIDRRRLRQQIGEDFLDFADTYFVNGYMLNRVVVKERVLEDYLALYPGHRKFMDTRRIKDKCRLYAQYSRLHYNPGAGPDGRIKSSGFEFVIVANDDHNAQTDNTEKVYKDTAVQRIERDPF